MSESLTADEIAQLFAAAKDGALPAGPRRRARQSRSIRAIDFRRPMPLSPAEQERFERIHAGLCRDAAGWLTGELQTHVEMEVLESTQLIWQAAVGSVPQPAVHFVASVAPGAATVTLCIERAVLLAIVERMLGGEWQGRSLTRPPTDMDLAVGRSIFEGLIERLSRIWQDAFGRTVEPRDFESPAQSIERLPAIVPTLALTIEMRIGGDSSSIVLLVPAVALGGSSEDADPEGSQLALPAGPGPGAAGHMLSALNPVRVKARAEAGGTEMRIAEVVALTAGDVVQLGAAGEGTLTVAGCPILRVKPGRNGEFRAVQVLSPIVSARRSAPAGGGRRGARTEDALVTIGEVTAEATLGVLDTLCGGGAELGRVSVVPLGSSPFESLTYPALASGVSYTAAASGQNLFIITRLGARRLAAAMMSSELPSDGDSEDLEEIELSALGEAMNQMMAAGASAMSSLINQAVDISAPTTRVLGSQGAAEELYPQTQYATRASLTVLGGACRLVQLVPNDVVTATAAAIAEAARRPAGEEAEADSSDRLRAMLGRARVHVTAELGGTSLSLEDTARVAAGSVITLDRPAEDPVDLCVNGRRFATGDLVMQDEAQWALRIGRLLDGAPIDDLSQTEGN